ncbi:MAG TPA: 3-phenylpropionate/cinnamic acid dioxygenase subunit beta [Chloroflexota bacterium]|jgi:biphenyl 2,3-dioxygenase beta subunit
MVSAELQHEVEQFLYAEASLLDEHRFRDWLDLWTQDAHYWMPLRITVGADQTGQEWTQAHENSYFDDDKPMLEQRVAKLETGFAWSEDPPSRTRRLLSNVRVREEGPGQIIASCNFIVYRNRLATDEDWWVGRREDTLRQDDGEWKISERKIFLDQTTLKSKNLSNFF